MCDVRRDYFKAMLVERKVDPFSSWEKELPKIVGDPRFMLLSYKERFQVFDEYVKERLENEMAKQGFKQLLMDAKLNGKWSFSDFASHYGKDSRFWAIEKTDDREKLFTDYITELRKVEERRLLQQNEMAKRAKRMKQEEVKRAEQMKVKMANDGFMQLLSDSKLHGKSSFGDFSSMYSNDHRFKAMEKMDNRETLFTEYVAKLRKVELEQRRLQIEKERAKIPLEVRKANFKEMLFEKMVDVYSASWEKERLKIANDPRYRLMATKDREDVYEAWGSRDVKRVERRKKTEMAKEGFKQLLIAAKLNGKSVFSDFAANFHTDSRFKAIDKMDDRETLFKERVVYLDRIETHQRLIQKQKEEQLRARIPPEVRMEKFKALLIERGVGPSSTWEMELPNIANGLYYWFLTGEEGRQVFDSYVNERKEEVRIEQMKKNELAKNGFKQLMIDAQLNGKWLFSDFSSKYGNHSRFKAVENMNDRWTLFTEYKTRLRAEEALQLENLRARIPLDIRIEKFKEMLIERKFNVFSTRHTEWPKIVNDPRIQLLSHKEQNCVFDACMKEEKEKEEKEEKARLKKIKIAEDGFNELLSDAQFNGISKFDKFAADYRTDSRFQAVREFNDPAILFNEYRIKLEKAEMGRCRFQKEVYDAYNANKTAKKVSNTKHQNRLQKERVNCPEEDRDVFASTETGPENGDVEVENEERVKAKFWKRPKQERRGRTRYWQEKPSGKDETTPDQQKTKVEQKPKNKLNQKNYPKNCKKRC